MLINKSNVLPTENPITSFIICCTFFSFHSSSVFLSNLVYNLVYFSILYTFFSPFIPLSDLLVRTSFKTRLMCCSVRFIHVANCVSLSQYSMGKSWEHLNYRTCLGQNSGDSCSNDGLYGSPFLSFLSNHLLSFISRLSLNGNCSSLYRLGTDCTEKTASNSFSIVVCVTQSIPSNGRFPGCIILVLSHNTYRLQKLLCYTVDT
jgi:hypothetical protein